MNKFARVSVAILVAALLLPTARATAGVSTDWCSDIAPPCVISAHRNAVEVPKTDPDWNVIVVDVPGTDSDDFLWNVTSKHTGFDLGEPALADDWEIVFDTGTTIPRVAFVRGADETIIRTDDEDGTYKIEVDASPVLVTGECDQGVWPWTCSETATTEQVELGGEVTDYSVWDDVAQREAMWGMNLTTNIAATSLPPEIIPDPKTGEERLLIRAANNHFRVGGSIVFEGDLSLHIPNDFLELAFGIDDPASIVAPSVLTTVSGPSAGSGTTTVTAGEEFLDVSIEGMTFSHRRVLIARGKIKPGKPKAVEATRLRKRIALVRWNPAKERGSEITGYRVRCKARRGTSKGGGVVPKSPVEITGLEVGVPYDCRVRALSKAGPGPWSPWDGVPAHKEVG